MKKHISLTTETYARVISLFSNKQWPIENDGTNNLSLFNRYCIMLSTMTPQQQDLILELSESYLKIGVDEYLFHLTVSLQKAVTDPINQDISTFFVLPLISPNDIGKIKSSTFIAYHCKSVTFSYQTWMENKTLNVIDKVSSLPENFNTDLSSTLILVDDFVGSGDTARQAIDYICSQGIDLKKIFVVTLVAQQAGIADIGLMGVKIYTSITRQKGISDKHQNQERQKRLDIMDEIELTRNISAYFRYGYSSSEALITMNRTPDNTFPIFWHEVAGQYISPFPRGEN